MEHREASDDGQEQIVAQLHITESTPDHNSSELHNETTTSDHDFSEHHEKKTSDNDFSEHHEKTTTSDHDFSELQERTTTSDHDCNDQDTVDGRQRSYTKDNEHDLEESNVRPLSRSSRFPQNTLRATLTRTPSQMMSQGDDRNDELFVMKESSSVLITEVQISNAQEENIVDEKNTGTKTGYYEEDAIDGTTACIETSTTQKEFTEEDYDTDLDDEDDKEEEEIISYYKSTCEQLGLVPVKYFIRHIKDASITMRYRGLGSDAVKAIALSLRDNITLDRLDISGNWIGAEGSRSICRLLEENDSITNIALNDNKIGSDGGLYVAKMIRVNTGLRKLDLSGNALDDKCAEALALALESNKSLRELNLSHNNLTEIGAYFIGMAIGANENLDILNLSWNHLREHGGIEIAKGLKENIRLKVCNLSWNGLATQAGLAIVDALSLNQSLQELDISGNRLTLEVATKLAKVLAANDVIKVVKLGNNCITSAGAIALATVINNTENCELQELDLTDVPVEYEFLRTMEEIQRQKPHFRIKHGPVIRAGNTTDDLSKPAIDVDIVKKQPVVILKEHIVVNDMRLVDILQRYDRNNTFSVSIEDFLAAVEDLAVNCDKIRLKESLQKCQMNKSGTIYFGHFISDSKRAEKSGDL